MLTIEVSRSRSGGRCAWEKGGFNGEDSGYSQIITDKFGNAKVAMMHNNKENIVCGNHVLFGLREGDLVITDFYHHGMHHIRVMQVTGFVDICDISLATLDLCWEYANKQWSPPSSVIHALKENISTVIDIVMDKAMYEACSEGFYYKERKS
jgi:succinate dehydrogenase flavin-adding protein (antitoxin of CptAB toxin-antitoxin module)